MESINLITIGTVTNICKELDLYDLKSLIFLLYDNAESALEKFKRKDNDVLRQWLVESASNTNWKSKFVEAMAICKLYGVLRRLGIDPTELKPLFLPQNPDIYVYINPVKKLLYHISEHVPDEEFKIVSKYFNDTNSADILELFLKKTKKPEELLKGLLQIPGLKKFKNSINNYVLLYLNIDESVSCSEISSSCSEVNYKPITELNSPVVFEETSFNYFNCENQTSAKQFQHTQSDRGINKHEYYPIKDTKQIGLAYIINQEKFDNSKRLPYIPHLENRDGSQKDKTLLTKVLNNLKFKVISRDNLSSNNMIICIEHVINEQFLPQHSIFFLCILSHGQLGQVFGVDCVPINIKDIQKRIDAVGDKKLHNIPKVLVVQACQTVQNSLHPDSGWLPSDYLIHWATAPELEAFRMPERGSVFIQVFCRMLSESDLRKEHLADVCLKVNRYVVDFCLGKHKEQVPIIHISLQKKIYLRPPY